jgi:ppGpp synthetase/RelA/SpoT-type nucleotidyltranferase
MNLEEEYTIRYYKALLTISIDLENELKSNLEGILHIDRIYSRAKSIDRFMQKARKKDEEGNIKYSDPLYQIQDQIGARIIVFYLDDINPVEKKLLKYYTPIEEQLIFPDSEKEFDYEGKHFIFLVPSDVIPDNIDENLVPMFFELQIKTLYQHAFSEASHDLAYKPNVNLTRDQKRKVAYASAQSWGADQVFSELAKELLK